MKASAKILLMFIILMNLAVKTSVEFQKIFITYKNKNTESFTESC